ncbi:MAG: DUF5615 family PIN-like protein [Myxococcales bacterium]|nr:DUF5615 family PIN-like protein [Myxococcales bacterium]
MRFLFDEDVNQRIVRGLLRRIPSLDHRSAHDRDLEGQSDDHVLAAAAAEGRLLVSHDVATMTAAHKARLDRGDPVPGLLLIPQSLPVGRAVEDLELVSIASDQRDWDGIVEFLPLT